jgi:hypothetical protein
MIKPSLITEGMGWIGIALVLLAYGLLTAGAVGPGDRTFHALNALGAVGIAVDASAQRNWQPMVLNAVWFVVAVVGFALAGN